ncbi:ParA family protein [Plesiomonas shigelloides]|uniref:ParA family protein n=1 Tax=Plesiomonas shigelloides TaxID=703 RepID=UPI001C5B2C66|nr:ParA family protein [Plesiomonas shigelloides]MBW3793273.1 ParA family protein [Plesiomonas shigelloides]
MDSKLQRLEQNGARYRIACRKSAAFVDEQTHNGKPFRTYTQNEAAKALGINNRQLVKLCEQHGLDVPMVGCRWSLPLPDLFRLREAIGQQAKANASRMIVSSVLNIKGGVGKTTTAMTLATGLAIEAKTQYRILVVDADGQTNMCTGYMAPQIDTEDTVLSELLTLAGDPTLSDSELAQQVTAALKKTNIPNLDLLPGGVADKLFEAWVQRGLADGKITSPYSLLSRLLSVIAPYYDVVLIDTSPALNFLLYNVLAASDVLIVPVKPDHNDTDATGDFLSVLPQIKAAIEAHCPLHWSEIKLIMTDLDKRSVPNQQKAAILRELFGQDLMLGQIPHSEAIKHCSSLMSSIYELSPSEYPGGRASLINAQAECLQAVFEFEEIMQNIWRKEANHG